MVAHCLFCARRVMVAKADEQTFVFIKRFGCDAGVEHQTENVQVDMLSGQRLPHDVVASDPQDGVMEMSIGAGKAGIAAVAIDWGAAVLHVSGDCFNVSQRLRGHVARREAGAFGFQQQAEFVKIVELLARQLGRCGIADQMRLANQPFAFQTAKRLAHRGLRDVQIPRQNVDGNPSPRRNFQRHQAFVNVVVNPVDHADGPQRDLPAVTFCRQCHPAPSLLDTLPSVADMLSYVKSFIIYDLIQPKLAGIWPVVAMGNRMQTFATIRSPREILFGPGQRFALAAVARRLGSRALVVTDPRLANDADFLAMVSALGDAGLETRVDATTLPDVPVDSAIAAAKAHQGFGADLVIGVGGGSCLDMAKCVALLLTYGGRPQDYYGELLVPGPILPLIAVPTTAGTGSEVTPVAVLSDSERLLKVGISSPHLIPVAAICDPDLTMTCPPGLTAIAGADALTHAIEAFTAIRRPLTPGLAQERVFVGKNLASDQFALRAVRLLWEGLEVACTNGADADARGKVMLGATFAGLAFGVAGTAAAHAIQYPIGALTHTAHGSGVACLMPYVMAWNAPVIGQELAEIANAMGLGHADQVIPALAALFHRIGIPRTLQDLGVTEDRLDWVAAQALGIGRLMQNNPRPIAPDDMRQILEAAFTGYLAINQPPA